MEISCDIIRDLLPLYAEDMVSGDSRIMVDAHLCTCEDCNDQLERMRKRPELQTQTDTSVLQNLDRRIRRRRMDAVLLAMFVTAAVLFSMFMYLYRPVYLTKEEAITQVTNADGVVTIEFTPEAGYFRSDDTVDPDTGRKSVTIIAARHKWDVLTGNAQGKGRRLYLNEDTDIWYASTDSGVEDIQLWGDSVQGGRISLPRLVLGYYFILAFGIGMVLCIFAIVLRKKKSGKVTRICALLCFSFALSDLIATGGNWRIYDAHDVPILIALIMIQTALLGGSIAWGIRFYEKGRADRG